jgi:hypothetical protein
MRLALAGFATGALLAVVTGCGGGGGDTAEEASDHSAPILPPCAGAGAAETPPSALPVEFPLPAGTVITSSKSPFESQVVVLALIPAELQEAASFFGRILPEHGYEVGIGDAEGTEAEAPFTGNGYRGKWRVNAIPDCRAVRLTLVLIEQA